MQDQSNREITLDIQSVKLHLRSFLCPFSYQDINGEVQDLRESPAEHHAGKSTVHITDSPETWHTCTTSLVH